MSSLRTPARHPAVRPALAGIRKPSPCTLLAPRLPGPWRYGALVFVFQQGHLSGVLNFSSTGFIDEMTPIIMFCTLFGLSMDYEVFLLARIREDRADVAILAAN